MTFSYSLRSHIPCSPQSAGGFGLVFLPVILRVHGDLCPNQMSRLTPVVEQNTSFEQLATGRNYDNVMLTHGIDERLSPAEVERLLLQHIQANDKLRCLLQTPSAYRG